MAFVVELENGEMVEIEPDLRNPFRTIQQVIRSSQELENKYDSKVKLHRVVIEVPQLTDDSVKFMRNRLGVKIRREKDDAHVVEFESDPVTFYAHYLAVISSIDLGEKLYKLKESKHYAQHDKEYLKIKVRDTVKNGNLRHNCPLVKQIAKLNGTNTNQVIAILARYRKDRVREIFKATYEIVFDEPYKDNETKNAKNLWSKEAKEKYFTSFSDAKMSYFTTNNMTATNTGWNFE